ncbi:hypothetical protein [Pedomonas mirosovicensis]|uniref:hypothetical protein n=1 Tax=Pedomonas mirosovicensis TaxID=2908641 RepID=UPI0021698F27|nr:hypothetical protein [Pedomonas mirosovicensis]MCH8686807.1 hypothetical protein [Pedomonas mirosovicensis]
MIGRLVFFRLPAAARWRAVLPGLAFLAFLLCLPVAPAISQALTAPAPAEEEAPAPVDPYGRGTPEEPSPVSLMPSPTRTTSAPAFT